MCMLGVAMCMLGVAMGMFGLAMCMLGVAVIYIYIHYAQSAQVLVISIPVS